MRLPSRFAITALRQTFSAGILKAYIASSDTIGEKDSKCSELREPLSEDPVYQELGGRLQLVDLGKDFSGGNERVQDSDI